MLGRGSGVPPRAPASRGQRQVPGVRAVGVPVRVPRVDAPVPRSAVHFSGTVSTAPSAARGLQTISPPLRVALQRASRGQAVTAASTTSAIPAHVDRRRIQTAARGPGSLSGSSCSSAFGAQKKVATVLSTVVDDAALKKLAGRKQVEELKNTALEKEVEELKNTALEKEVEELKKENAALEKQVEELRESAKSCERLKRALADALRCAICLDVSRRNVRLDPCGHVFCERCAASWYVRSPTCSVCRKGVLTTDVDSLANNIVEIMFSTLPDFDKSTGDCDRSFDRLKILEKEESFPCALQ